MSSQVTDNLVRIETRFGTFDASRDDFITFPEGMPGFNRCRQFVLIASDDLAPLRCLQALDSPHPSFLAIDPLMVVPDYPCLLTAADRARLDARADDALLWLAVVTISAEDSATVNLRAPLVINPRAMIGCQLVPQDWFYPVAYPLMGR